MIPSIGRLQERNWVGICHFDVVDIRHVASVDPVVMGTVAGVTLKEGMSWSRIFLEDGGGQFRDRWVPEKGDVVSVATLAGAIAKDRLELMPHLWELKHHRYLVLVTNRNGDRLLMGTLKAPCQMLVTERKSGDGDKVESDRNELQISTKIKWRLPVPYYGAEPPPPGVPQSCPTLQELIAAVSAAVILGLLSASQAAGLLAGLVEAATPAQLLAVMTAAQITYVVEEESQGVRIRIELANGTVVDGPLIADGGQHLMPAINVRNTGDTATLWKQNGDEPDVVLPQMQIKALNNNGTEIIEVYRNVLDGSSDRLLNTLDDGDLNHPGLLPRFTVFRAANPSTPIATGDIANPTTTIQIPLPMGWAAGDGATLPFTIPGHYAGSYNSFALSGSNGTITYSINGGSPATLGAGVLVLATGDTLELFRTTTTAAGGVSMSYV